MSERLMKLAGNASLLLVFVGVFGVGGYVALSAPPREVVASGEPQQAHLLFTVKKCTIPPARNVELVERFFMSYATNDGLQTREVVRAYVRPAMSAGAWDETLPMPDLSAFDAPLCHGHVTMDALAYDAMRVQTLARQAYLAAMEAGAQAARAARNN